MTPSSTPSWSSTEVRRKVLAFAFCLDSIGVVDIAYRAAAARPERLEQMEGMFGVLADNLWLRVLLGLVAIGASVRFSWGPGRVGSAFLALVATGINYTYCAEFTGSVPNVLVCTGLAMIAWLATFVSARMLWPAHARPSNFLGEVEKLAGMAALAAFGIYFFKAGLSKYFNSGWDWADGSKIRSLMLMYAYSPESVIGSVQEVIVNSANLSRFLATVTLIAQLGALVFPFTRKGRIVVGTMLLGFELSVYFIAGIFAPGNIALIVGFSFPWHRLGRSGRAGDDERSPIALPKAAPGRSQVVLLALGVIGLFFWVNPWTPVRLGTPPNQMAGSGQGESIHRQADRSMEPMSDGSEEVEASNEEAKRPRQPVAKEFVIEGSQQPRVQALLKDVGFNKDLGGGYRFSRIMLERTAVLMHLTRDGSTPQAAGSLRLEHASLARKDESRSRSFVLRLESGDDKVADRHLRAAMRSIVSHDEGGYFLEVEKAPETP
jgi:hypothetical protein